MFTLLRNVDTYLPNHIGLSDILLCGEKIVKVERDISWSEDETNVIDCSGKIATPGYIDQHVHVTGGGGEGSFRSRVPELQLSQCIQAGVTTVVGLLGTDSITRSVENLVAKTKSLREEGISAYCLTGSYEYPTRTLTGDLKKDIAYISEIIGVKVAIADHRAPHITKQELIRLVSDVRVSSLISGKPGLVVFHLGRGKDQLKLIRDVISETELPIKHFRPTHVQKVHEQAIEFAKLGGYIDYTTGSSAESAARHVAEALRQGTPHELITISTDSNGSLPRWNEAKEMVGLTAASINTLHQAVKSLVEKYQLDIPTALSFATINVAAALEISAAKGSLSPGKDADILLLDRDFNVDGVIARGQIMMLDKNLKVVGTFEQ